MDVILQYEDVDGPAVIGLATVIPSGWRSGGAVVFDYDHHDLIVTRPAIHDPNGKLVRNLEIGVGVLRAGGHIIERKQALIQLQG